MLPFINSMSTKSSEIDWKVKYESMKKSFEKLDKLRHGSIREDITDLKQKIEEHEQIHTISINELKAQNEQMRQSVKRNKELQNKIAKKQESISKLKADLAARDLVLKESFKVENLHIIDAKKDYYEFNFADKFQFKLKKHNDNKTYEYILKSQSEELPNYFCGNYIFDYSNLSKFFKKFDSMSA